MSRNIDDISSVTTNNGTSLASNEPLIELQKNKRRSRLSLKEAASAAHIGSHHSISTGSQQNNAFSNSQEQQQTLKLQVDQPQRPNSLNSSIIVAKEE